MALTKKNNWLTICQETVSLIQQKMINITLLIARTKHLGITKAYLNEHFTLSLKVSFNPIGLRFTIANWMKQIETINNYKNNQVCSDRNHHLQWWQWCIENPETTISFYHFSQACIGNGIFFQFVKGNLISFVSWKLHFQERELLSSSTIKCNPFDAISSPY